MLTQKPYKRPHAVRNFTSRLRIRKVSEQEKLDDELNEGEEEMWEKRKKRHTEKKRIHERRWGKKSR